MNVAADFFCITKYDTDKHLSEGYGDPVFDYALDQIRDGRLGAWMVNRERLCNAVAIIASESRSQFREEELADALVEHCGDELRAAMEGAE